MIYDMTSTKILLVRTHFNNNCRNMYDWLLYCMSTDVARVIFPGKILLSN